MTTRNKGKEKVTDIVDTTTTTVIINISESSSSNLRKSTRDQKAPDRWTYKSNYAFMAKVMEFDEPTSFQDAVQIPK